MDWKNQLTKTPYLVLFVILISVGVGSASAVVTITLAGDVVIDGDLDMTGGTISNVVSPLELSDVATKQYVDITSNIVDPNFQTQIDNIETETDKIQSIKDNQFIPFSETYTPLSTEICDNADGIPDTDTIQIGSTMTPVIIQSVVVEVVGIDHETDQVRTSFYKTGGVTFSNTFSADLTDNVGGILGHTTFEVMGLDTFTPDGDPLNGHYPMQLATAPVFTAGIGIHCDAGTSSDLKIQQIIASGLKPVGSTVNIVLQESSSGAIRSTITDS